MPSSDPKRRAQVQKEYRERQKAMGNVCKTTWMFVFYEDSCPYWREELDELGLPCVVSPLHDRDVWTARDEAKDARHRAGALKKPHRHLLVQYPHSTPYSQVMEDFAFLNSKNCKYAKSVGSMAAYLCHLKSPDKAQYSPDGIVEFGGANWRDWCAQTDDLHGEMMAMRAHIIEHAKRTGRADLYEFWMWCDEHNDVWSRLLDTTCSAAIERFMKTIRGAMKTGTWMADEAPVRPTVVDDETGERVAEFEDAGDAAEYCEAMCGAGRDVRLIGVGDARCNTESNTGSNTDETCPEQRLSDEVDTPCNTQRNTQGNTESNTPTVGGDAGCADDGVEDVPPLGGRPGGAREGRRGTGRDAGRSGEDCDTGDGGGACGRGHGADGRRADE